MGRSNAHDDGGAEHGAATERQSRGYRLRAPQGLREREHARDRHSEPRTVGLSIAVAGRDDIGARKGSTAYPITEIRGIGADVAAILKSEGIRTTIGLLRSANTPKQRLKIAEKTGTDKKRVLDWVTTADRMRVKGIGWEYAQLLHAAGVNTVNELRFRNPERLAREIAEANNRRKLVSVLPSVAMVARWIDDAKKLAPVVRY